MRVAAGRRTEQGEAAGVQGDMGSGPQKEEEADLVAVDHPGFPLRREEFPETAVPEPRHRAPAQFDERRGLFHLTRVPERLDDPLKTPAIPYESNQIDGFECNSAWVNAWVNGRNLT